MERNELLIQLQEMAGRILEVEPNTVDPEVDLTKELGADSLDLIEFVLAVEYEFDIRIEDSYAHQIRTLNDALFYLEHEIEEI